MSGKISSVSSAACAGAASAITSSRAALLIVRCIVSAPGALGRLRLAAPRPRPGPRAFGPTLDRGPRPSRGPRNTTGPLDCGPAEGAPMLANRSGVSSGSRAAGARNRWRRGALRHPRGGAGGAAPQQAAALGDREPRRLDVALDAAGREQLDALAGADVALDLARHHELVHHHPGLGPGAG